MSKYLTDAQILKAQHELTILFALPFATELFGTAWEQILAEVKGGVWTGKRDNRPNPDLYVMIGEKRVNYSVKCERIRATRIRPSAKDFLGETMDFIVARPKVDELLTTGNTIVNMDATALGSLVLKYYNEQIVRRYEWNVLSFMVPVSTGEFIYWEESPPREYDPSEYWWKDTGKAAGSNRNIAGYPISVAREGPLPASMFRWTSGGKQFYIVYRIPESADIFSVERVTLTSDELWSAIEAKLHQKKAKQGLPKAT
jgi:hypothetical protein